MANRPHSASERTGWLGYSAAIFVSALGHAALLAFAFLVMPRLLHSETVAPPTYTVKIVDDIPAGDLGTHLPRLSGHKKSPPPEQVAKAELPKPEEPKVEPPNPADDSNAISLKTIEATPTPTPAPEVVPKLVEPTATPTPKKIARPRSTPAPVTVKPNEHPRNHKGEPVAVAKAEATPNVQEQLRRIRQQLMKEHLQERKTADEDDEGDDDSQTASASAGGGGGPVAGSASIEGKGYGIGPGTGSAGELQDLQFLLYYRTVQQKIKDAWIFSGGSNDLTATVDFSIGPDGNLTGVKIKQGSGDTAFDESVVRAIRRAAPFPSPPEKYRSEFQSGVAALFKLGELKS